MLQTDIYSVTCMTTLPCVPAPVENGSGYLHALGRRVTTSQCDLLNPPPLQVDISDLDGIPLQPNFEYLTNTDEAPTENEIADALKHSKITKAQELMASLTSN